MWDLRRELNTQVHALIPPGGDANDVGDDVVMAVGEVSNTLKLLLLHLPRVGAQRWCARLRQL